MKPPRRTNLPAKDNAAAGLRRATALPPSFDGTARFTYDGSFDGLLCVLLACWESRRWPEAIQPEDVAQGGLFSETQFVPTDEARARRVWEGLLKYMPGEARTNLYKTFLSESPERELLIFRYTQLAIEAGGQDISENFGNDTVRAIADITKQMFREKHRMEAFVRFEKTHDGLFHATIEPDYDVLPLIAEHFTKRYADQRWLIFDRRRRYGLYYDLERTDIVSFDAEAGQQGSNSAVSAAVLDEREPLFQSLWQTYFDHVNIPERRNIKLHRRHMPKRYWKYLTEKQPRERHFRPIDNKQRPPQ
ncbi:TIGR03915 family putative DNA repair protein [Hymenobacter latericus]|uniref:TIGR03915 family putative DNA repair protein n=1 Tax=Hymenobacter sp. YIM 151858-1 TaxID=2987688 RepID=UPI00222761AD|nr:TIGR03915 family putative DNA repair protein [Hymenobacter sp. YIM 151858-1]UYZ57565.1 TIGR03915 family putative DNA repair protein [Hymenobacter sp. YIM 151858-1]